MNDDVDYAEVAELEDELAGAAIGDADATRRLALRLKRGVTAPDDTKTASEFVLAAARFRINFPDIAQDDEGSQLAVKIDKGLADKYPDMNFDERLNLVGNAVRQTLGDPETRDARFAIASTRLARTTPEAARAAALAEAAQYENQSVDPEDAAIEEARRDAINALSEERAAKVIERDGWRERTERMAGRQ